MPQTETWTIKRLLEWTTEFFGRHDSDSPRLEAEILLAAALGCERIQLYTRFADVPEEPALGRFRAWVKRRAAGEPVAYLVGHREFYSLKFQVDSKVLIPRPETEHVVVETIECAKEFTDTPLEIADVGTGSGCLAVAVAKHIPRAKVLAIDISADALEVAKANVNAHQLGDRIEFIESDVFDQVPSRQFQLIISNPPYIGTDEIDTVEESVRKYEPEIALFAGSDGMDVIEKLLASANERLVAGGFLIFESSPLIMERCLQLVGSQSGIKLCKTVKDLAGHRRVIVAQKQ
jgi:release factor glutamine methyltransferase